MANINNGVAVNFGITGLTFTFNSLTGFFLPQDFDHSMERDMEAIRDGNGTVVNRTWYNPEMKASLTWIPKDSIALSTAVTNTQLTDKGTFITISAFTDYSYLLSVTSTNTKWEVHGAKTKTSNTKVKMITFDLVWNAAIQATISS